MDTWKPFPKQQEALERSEFEVLFGGSRGPGKTDAGIVWLLGEEYKPGKRLYQHPDYRALIIRSSYKDLSDWLDRANKMFRGLKAEITGNPAVIKFPSGAIFRTGHLRDRKSYEQYIGHEYQRILIEELTLIAREEHYIKIQGSCRSTVAELKPQMFATTNPGNVGHSWVKKRFVDPSVWGKPFMGADGRSRIFIHATVDDNPMLIEKDPGYLRFLDGLKNTNLDLWKAWRMGEWDSFVGQAFSEWEHSKHVTTSFDVPIDEFVLKIISFDWGYRAPGVATWIGITPENSMGIARAYVYREIHQNGTKPREWVKDIEKFTEKERVNYMVLPHDCFNVIQGMDSIATQFRKIDNTGGIMPIREGKTLQRGARLNRKAITHNYLAIAPDGKPYLQFHQNCINCIRTIPELVYDDTNPEDINSEADNDHCYDAFSLGLLTLGLKPGESSGVKYQREVAPSGFKHLGDGVMQPRGDFWEAIKNKAHKRKQPENK